MKTVLVVDPAEDDRFIARTVLRDAGFETVEARDPAQALAILRRRRVDAIISALVLEGMTCPEFLRRIRRMASSRDIPVLIASSFWDLVPEEANALDVAARIEKPITRRGIARLLEQLLGSPATPAESPRDPNADRA